ncbi:SsrA-binding protein SmpB [Azospirillum sp. CT11-132]|uniref:SsrA-binding protein SmpB n=1 Tax=unclassified Azospirillum TaxID=2630922 RepID=UPI000D6193D3|nr:MULTISPECIES: SsrA-binding protein SmpB [unclassified Azospirillum]KAA0583163.1 SsrA-binding protein SmpB [Azospirillum sp. B21]MBF5095679.1 SsrA-binding protein SmpB [Azospirillum sp. INR13]MDR6770628.1 SsrA-binding protein [Azospirillum sp. BE72]PWC54865.1 SsrA-binding protein [Azospirillum sp. TSH7]PWC68281.1 SsrA-binding protein [Azospirillum sp. TSH20]
MATREEAKKFAAQNRRARFDFFIDDVLEAGIMLTGSEVKSLRGGRASVNEAYAGLKGGELYLFNAYIPEYLQAGRVDQHEPKRPRKLLVRRRELDKLAAGIKQKGVTLVPMSVYFNDRGIAKVEIGLATGKKKHDKRQNEKERSWQRDKARLMRDKG